jgi:peptidoglycan/LPS O-acetylase OafA/YrhL
MSIPSLDGLRAVAILLVFLSHWQEAAGVPRFIPGNFGVTLFFFLSGYLITTLMRVEIERTGTLSIRLFYLRRALRIFPTCYLVLAAAALYGWSRSATDMWFLVGQAVHLTNYQIILHGWEAPIAPHTDVFWSLAVEEHFYLAFPALFLVMIRRMPLEYVANMLLCVCAAVFLWRCLLVFGLGAHPDRTYLGTDTRIDSILFGCVLALRGNPALDSTAIEESTWKRYLFPVALAVLFASQLVGGRAFRETFGYSIQGLCLFVVFVVAVRYPSWGVIRVLNWTAMRWIGLLSFAIYLVHPAMLAAAVALVGRSVFEVGAVATLLTLAASAMLYYGVERPMSGLRRRFSVTHGVPSHPGRVQSSYKTSAAGEGALSPGTSQRGPRQ